MYIQYMYLHVLYIDKVIYGGCQSHGGTPSQNPFENGLSIINHPFWGYPHLWKPPCMYIYIYTQVTTYAFCSLKVQSSFAASLCDLDTLGTDGQKRPLKVPQQFTLGIKSPTASIQYIEWDMSRQIRHSL